MGLEDQAAHLPQRVLGFLEVLGVHLPLVVLGAQGGPSFQLAQEAPYLLAALSNLGRLRQTTVKTRDEQKAGFTHVQQNHTTEA